MTNQMNVTDLGLLNINRKIIDSRKYKDNLISTVGVATIIDGNASGFDKDSYLYKDNLSFKANSALTIEFRGAFLPTEEPQTAWKIQGTENSLSLQLTDSAIKVILNNSTVLSVPIAKITDTTNIRVATNIGAGKCEVIAFLNDRVYQKNILGTTINTQDFKRVIIGNDPANTSTFWKGSFIIQNFSITENGSLIYTPSTGYPITFTKILVSDGEFPLTNTTPVIADHIYEYKINEVTRSGNTVLLTSQVGEDANIIIKEIGLYAETDEGEILFSNLSGLNITTGKEVPYDLVLTINTTLSFVNVVGFPDVGSIVVKDPEYCTFKDFKTVKDLTLYILTNLERLVVLNATNIGYRKAQVFYRLQREIERQEECFASVQTFSKLMKKIHREIKLIFDPDAIEVVGKENFDDPGNPIITSDGEASGFESNKYVKSYIPFSSDEAWELYSTFSVDEHNNSTILTLSNDSSIQPLVESLAPTTSSWTTQQVGTSTWRGIAYGNGKFIAVGSSGYIATLEDGSSTWETQQVGTSTWNGLAYGNGKFIAVGYNGYIATLEDSSATWETQRVGTSYWEGVAYGNGKFVAVGSDGYIATLEDDSDTWETQQIGRSYYWEGVAYGNGKFIAVGDDHYIATLEDGDDTWDIQQVGSHHWEGIAYGNGKFIAVGWNNYIATLEDGSDAWTTQQVGDYYYWWGITYGNGKFVAVGSDGYIATLEDDSDTWTTQQVGSYDWHGIAYGNGKFIAVGWNGYNNYGYIATSKIAFNLKIGKENNITATILSEDIEYTQDDSMEVYRKFYSNYYNVNITENHVANNFNGKELSVNIESQSIESSYEEIISFTTPSQLNEYWKCTIQNPIDSGFKVSLKYDETTNGNIGMEISGKNIESDSAWDTQRTGTSSWLGITYGNGKFIAIGDNGYIDTLEDGSTTWETQQVGTQSWRGGAYGNGKFIAVGWGGRVATSEDNGNTWTTQQVGAYHWNGITYGNGKFIAVRADGNIATLEDDSTWTPPAQVGTSSWNGVTYGNGKFIAVGDSGYIATLEDGNNAWSTQQVGTHAWYGVAYGNGKFIAVGYNGYVATLEDGSNTWNIQRVSTPSWRGITYGNGKFIAVGDFGYVATLENDNNTWETQQVVGIPFWYGITYGNGKFIAVGHDGHTATLKSLFYSSAPFQPNTHYYLKLNFTKSSADTYNFMYSYSLTNEESSYIPMSNDSYLCSSSTPTISSFTLSGPPTYSLYLDELSIEIDGNQIINKSQNLQGWSTEEDPKVYNLHVAGNEVANTPVINPSESSTELVLNHGDIITNSWSMPIRIETNSLSSGTTNIYSSGGIAYGNGIFIAAETHRVNYGYISTSTNGITWSNPIKIGDYPINWKEITYENGKFIMVGSDGNVATSENGTTWTINETGDFTWQGGSYGNGKYVIVGNNGYIATSENETTWTTEQIVETFNWFGVAYGNGKFVAVGDSGYIATLEDTTWTLQRVGVQSNSWKGVAYGNGKFVAVGDSGYTTTSVDGITWTTPVRIGASHWTRVAYGNGKFVAVGWDGYTSTSTDGETWTPRVQIGTSDWWGVAYGNGKFVAVGGSGYAAILNISTPNWTTPENTTGLALDDLEAWLVDTTFFEDTSNSDNPKVFTALQSDGTFSTSYDGSAWEKQNETTTSYEDPFVAMSARGTQGLAITSNGRLKQAEYSLVTSTSQLDSSYTWEGMTYDGAKFIALSGDAYISTSTDNGKTWTTPYRTDYAGNYWRCIAYGNGTYVMINRGGWVAYSKDFRTWLDPTGDPTTTTIGQNRDWRAITFGKGLFVAIGYTGYVATSTDGINWAVSNVTNLGTRKWVAITFNGTKFIAFGEEAYISQGTVNSNSTISWSAAAQNSSLKTMTNSKITGALYDGGTFGYVVSSNSSNLWHTFDQVHPETVIWEYMVSIPASSNIKPLCYGNHRILCTHNDAITGTGKVTALRFTPHLGDSFESTSLPEQDWRALTSIGRNVFLGLNEHGYAALIQLPSITISSVGALGDHDWCALASNSSIVVALGKTGYVSVGTVTGSTPTIYSWTTPTQNGSLGNKTWKRLTWDGSKFIAISYRGYVSTSADGINWTPAVQSPIIEPTSDSYAWSAITYGDNKVLALSDEASYSVQFTQEEKWSTSTEIGELQYIVGSSSEAANNAPFKLSIQNSKLTFTPAIDTLYAWSTLEGSISTIVYTTSQFPASGDYIYSSNKRAIGKVSTAQISGRVVAYLNESGLLQTFYRDSSEDIENTTTLTSSNDLLENTHYDIEVSFDGTKYSLYYKLDNMGDTSIYPTSEVLNYYSAVPTSLGKHHSIALGSNNNEYKFLGNIDFSKTSLMTDNFNWVGSSQLNQIYSETIENDSTYTVYDRYDYPIEGVPITTDFGLAVSANTFNVEPNKKYYAKVTYDKSSMWTTPEQVGYSYWYGITYGNGKFIAVGYNGYVATSEDNGNTWETQRVENSHWYGIAYGNGKFIAVGSSGDVATLEDDSATWETQRVGTISTWYGVAHGNGKFIAVGGNDYAATLEDGSITWETQQILGNSIWQGVAYGNGKFIAVGWGGYIATLEDSSDTWEIQRVGTSNWGGVTYGNGKFIAVGEYGYVATLEDDSATWETQQVGTSNWRGVAYGNGKFIVVGYNGYTATNITGMFYKVYKSENGEDYTEEFTQIAEHKMSPVTSVYVGGLASANSSYVTDPFQGTVYLKNLRAISANADWSPTTIVGEKEPQVLQYYNIPKYNRSMYVLEDLCNPENTLTVLDTSFTGNTDKIDFSNPLGFSLCTKVFLEDAKDKLLLAKLSPVGDPYFLLSFEGESQEIKFILNTQTQTITLSKKLQTDELASYVESPILLSVILEVEDGLHTFSLYKNNDLIDQVSLGVEGFLDASNSYLTNYLSDPAESKIYVSDIIVVEGTLDTEQLYYVTNLTDTNF